MVHPTGMDFGRSITQMSNRFFSAETVIDSLRDNGYNNTAYALAELIDNSLQAKASRVEIGFIERKSPVTGRYNVEEITLWDDGTGMSSDLLLKAMQFGGGENRNDALGMGKFGMGLPNSSISQCQRVDVWSWKTPTECFHTYLDVRLMKAGKLEEVPQPEKKEIPSIYKKTYFSSIPESGTFIVWSGLDRLTWKTGKSIHRHCETLIGRLYRNFISDEQIKIESIIYREANANTLSAVERQSFVANDPMYLLQNTSLYELPGNYKGETFFELLDDELVSVKYTDDNDQESTANVRIRSSIVKKSIAREILKNSSTKLGSTRWGKHCAKNIGVSIVRANRELVLRDAFFTKELKQYKGRFIGIEIEFPPCLDLIFGVTNNKQDAVKLIPYEDLDTIAAQNGFDTEQEYKRDLADNNDPMLQVLNVVERLKVQIDAAAKALTEIPTDPIKNVASGTTSPLSDAASKATHGSAAREAGGHKTEDFDTPIDHDELAQHLKQHLPIDDKEAAAKAESIILTGTRFIIESSPKDSEAFFDVSTQKGLTLVLFNTNHVFHDKFLTKLSPSELDVMHTAIAGFARVMNETTDERRKHFLHSTRREWGIVVNDFLNDSDDNF